MGAFVAMEVSARLSGRALGRDLALDLISPPAPLETGDFLPHMAGGVVFNLARNAPWAFGLMTSLQGRLAKASPGILYNQLFATASGEDRDLAATADFEDMILKLIGRTLQEGAKGYRREILAFVRAGEDRLARVTAPVTLWQGTVDNWTPPAMADARAARLPNLRTDRRFSGLSHYSTLKAALAEIIAP